MKKIQIILLISVCAINIQVLNANSHRSTHSGRGHRNLVKVSHGSQANPNITSSGITLPQAAANPQNNAPHITQNGIKYLNPNMFVTPEMQQQLAKNQVNPQYYLGQNSTPQYSGQQGPLNDQKNTQSHPIPFTPNQITVNTSPSSTISQQNQFPYQDQIPPMPSTPTQYYSNNNIPLPNTYPSTVNQTPLPIPIYQTSPMPINQNMPHN